MRKALCWAGAVLLLVVPATGRAFPNEPTGYGGFEWGTSIRKISHLAADPDASPEAGFKIYQRQTAATPLFGNIPLQKMSYVFQSDQLVAGVMYVDGAPRFYEILKTIKKMHGNGVPTEQFGTPGGMVWDGKVSTITVTFDSQTQKGVVMVASSAAIDPESPAGSLPPRGMPRYENDESVSPYQGSSRSNEVFGGTPRNNLGNTRGVPVRQQAPPPGAGHG